MKFIIEGIDRLGKSTLTQGIQDRLGYFTVIHIQKPQKLKRYMDIFDESASLFTYQNAVYTNFFNLLESPGLKLIFDRGHLGECVYAPLYRKYDGNYVFEYERRTDTSSTKLILLTTDNFEFLVDDGLSLDFSRKEEEQDAFIEAFKLSSIKDKRIINVHNGKGGYKSKEEILDEVLKSDVL